MFTKFLALFALVAAANAGAILVPEAKIESFPVSKTTITGPSGEIKQEEHLPVVSHEPTLVEAPLAPLAPVLVPEIHHEVVPEVRLVNSIVHEEPFIRLIKPVVPLVNPTEHRHLLVRTVPHAVPFLPTHFRSVYGNYYY